MFFSRLFLANTWKKKIGEVLTIFLSSLNPTPAQPAFALSSNSTVSPILWYVTKKSQSSLDKQESGILKLLCGGAVVVGVVFGGTVAAVIVLLLS